MLKRYIGSISLTCMLLLPISVNAASTDYSTIKQMTLLGESYSDGQISRVYEYEDAKGNKDWYLTTIPVPSNLKDTVEKYSDKLEGAKIELTKVYTLLKQDDNLKELNNKTIYSLPDTKLDLSFDVKRTFEEQEKAASQKAAELTVQDQTNLKENIESMTDENLKNQYLDADEYHEKFDVDTQNNDQPTDIKDKKETSKEKTTEKTTGFSPFQKSIVTVIIVIGLLFGISWYTFRRR